MNGKNTDYEKYQYSVKEIIRYVSECVILCLVVDYLFYKNIWMLLLAVPLPVLYLKWKKKQLIRERKRRLNYQFRDALNSMSVAVQAGYSVENAVSACVRDLESGAFHRSFTPELADKLAALYGIQVEDILDDYTLFLHRGRGDFLRRYRETKGWNRQQLADHAKVGRTSIRCWETGQKTISQKCFHLLVENLGSDFLSMLRM